MDIHKFVLIKNTYVPIPLHSCPSSTIMYTPINITVCLLFHASLLYNTRYIVAKYLFHIYRDMSQCMHFYIYILYIHINHTLNYAHILPSSSLSNFYSTFLHVYLFNIVLNYIIIISFAAFVSCWHALFNSLKYRRVSNHMHHVYIDFYTYNLCLYIGICILWLLFLTHSSALKCFIAIQQITPLFFYF